MPDGRLTAKDAPVGGQAVPEGVMMRGVSNWAVAVRTPEGEIEVERRHRLLGPSPLGPPLAGHPRHRRPWPSR
jgi:hypothetical protein